MQKEKEMWMGKKLFVSFERVHDSDRDLFSDSATVEIVTY